MQETKLADEAFPQLTFEAMGYSAAHHGEGRWNGVAILSRRGLDDVVVRLRRRRRAGLRGADHDGALRRHHASSTVYVPNGRALDADHYLYKLAWLDRLAAHIRAVAAPGDPVIVAGDFNIAPTDADVYDPAVFVGATHVSEPERARLAALIDGGLVDVFRHHHPEPRGVYSWWDYRRGDFHEGRGMRIDLVLASPSVVERSQWCVIDRNARKGKSPSDHAPVVVDLAVIDVRSPVEGGADPPRTGGRREQAEAGRRGELGGRSSGRRRRWHARSASAAQARPAGSSPPARVASRHADRAARHARRVAAGDRSRSRRRRDRGRRRRVDIGEQRARPAAGSRRAGRPR